MKKTRMGMWSIAIAGCVAADEPTTEEMTSNLATGPVLVDSLRIGGSADQRGSAVVSDGSRLYVVGYDERAFAGGTQVHAVPLSLGAPEWSLAAPTGGHSTAATLAGSTIFAAGSARPEIGACGASDGVGGTEGKSMLASFDTSGSFHGCASPNYFPYRGGEGYEGVAAFENAIYAVGSAENCGFGHHVYTLAKYDTSGALIATATEPGVTVGTYGNCVGSSNALAIASLAGDLYVAGRSGLTADGGSEGAAGPMLMRFSTALSRVWKARPTDVGYGLFLGVAGHDGAIYAGGTADGYARTLIEKYDTAGQRVWSRLGGRGAIRAFASAGDRIFAVGSTSEGTAGGTDAVILELDPATGDTLSTTTFGGAGNDGANAAIIVGDDLYVVGETRSFTDGGNGSGENDILIVRYSIAEPDVTPPVLTLPGTIAEVASSAAGMVVSYAASALDDVDGDVAVTCSTPSGSLFSLGTTTVTCSATDAAGNTANGSFTVAVTYAWSGFLQPINSDNSSVFKLGSTVPVKLQLTGASAGVTDAQARISIAKVTSGVIGSYEEVVIPTAANTGNLFRYDAGTYIFNLGTKGLSTGTWAIRADLGDGVSRQVLIGLR